MSAPDVPQPAVALRRGGGGIEPAASGAARQRRSRTPSGGCCRPSGSACSHLESRCRRSANSPPGSASAATPCGRRSSRLPRRDIWCRVAAGTAARSWPTSCQRPRGDGIRFTRAEIDDALRLREILEVGAARMAASRTLTAAEREMLWTQAGRRPRRASPTTTGGWTRGCTSRSPRRPVRRRWCRWSPRTGCGSTAARPDPVAAAQHRALRRAARGDRDGDPGRRRRRRRGTRCAHTSRGRRPCCTASWTDCWGSCGP